jgi:glycosyltransferase involved in cell wall biosynthesis
MSMALPVIATNWSGVTAFLDESVGYPISVDRLEPAAGPDGEWHLRGLNWARPSVEHLRHLMRRAVSAPAEAAARGAKARVRMVERYSPDAIAKVLLSELERIAARMPSLTAEV